MHSIYRIVNAVDGRSYIGQTNNIKRRRKEHFVDLKAGVHHNPFLQNAYNKYGRSAFTFEVLEENVPTEMINEREVYWVEHFDSFNNGYNLSSGGDAPEIMKGTPCAWNGVEYPSIASAARALGINLASLQERLERGYTCDADMVRGWKREITYNGVVYPSITEAAVANGISLGAMDSRIRAGIFADEDLTSYEFVWNGTTYPNMVEAAKALGETVTRIHYWRRMGYKSPDDFPPDPKAKCVLWNGIEYRSIREAAEANGVNYSTMRSRVQAGFSCDDEIVPSQYPARSITINGVSYPTVKLAANSYDVSITTIYNWIKSGRAHFE